MGLDPHIQQLVAQARQYALAIQQWTGRVPKPGLAILEQCWHHLCSTSAPQFMRALHAAWPCPSPVSLQHMVYFYALMYTLWAAPEQQAAKELGMWAKSIVQQLVVQLSTGCLTGKQLHDQLSELVLATVDHSKRLMAPQWQAMGAQQHEQQAASARTLASTPAQPTPNAASPLQPTPTAMSAATNANPSPATISSNPFTAAAAAAGSSQTPAARQPACLPPSPSPPMPSNHSSTVFTASNYTVAQQAPASAPAAALQPAPTSTSAQQSGTSAMSNYSPQPAAPALSPPAAAHDTNPPPAASYTFSRSITTFGPGIISVATTMHPSQSAGAVKQHQLSSPASATALDALPSSQPASARPSRRSGNAAAQHQATVGSTGPHNQQVRGSRAAAAAHAQASDRGATKARAARPRRGTVRQQQQEQEEEEQPQQPAQQSSQRKPLAQGQQLAPHSTTDSVAGLAVHPSMDNCYSGAGSTLAARKRMHDGGYVLARNSLATAVSTNMCCATSTSPAARSPPFQQQLLAPATLSASLSVSPVSTITQTSCSPATSAEHATPAAATLASPFAAPPTSLLMSAAQPAAAGAGSGPVFSLQRLASGGADEEMEAMMRSLFGGDDNMPALDGYNSQLPVGYTGATTTPCKVQRMDGQASPQQFMHAPHNMQPLLHASRGMQQQFPAGYAHPVLQQVASPGMRPAQQPLPELASGVEAWCHVTANSAHHSKQEAGFKAATYSSNKAAWQGLQHASTAAQQHHPSSAWSGRYASAPTTAALSQLAGAPVQFMADDSSLLDSFFDRFGADGDVELEAMM